MPGTPEKKVKYLQGTVLCLQLLAVAMLRKVLLPKQQRAGHFSCCWSNVYE